MNTNKNSKYFIFGGCTDQRNIFELQDTGFNEVPLAYRKYYRAYLGDGDILSENEVLCPVCRVIIRSENTLYPDDKVFCLVCFSWLKVVMDGERRIAIPVFD